MANELKEENILIQAGLSEDQAQVYDMLLERGPQKASSISSWTGVKRGLTYKVLEQLEIMGLVEKKGGDGTVATFYPQHPSLLMHTLEGKEKELALAKEMLTFSLGTLSSKYNLITGKPSVQFYEGLEGVAKVMKDTLTTKGEILQLIDNEAIVKFASEINETYVKERNAKNIHKKMILEDTEFSRMRASTYDQKTIEVRFLPKADFAETAMQVYDDKVSYITLNNEKKVGIIIEDKNIALFQKSFFYSLWEKASE